FLGHQPDAKVDRDHRTPGSAPITKGQAHPPRLEGDTRLADALGERLIPRMLLEQILLAITVDLFVGKAPIPAAFIVDAGKQPGQFADEHARTLAPMRTRQYGGTKIESRHVTQKYGQSAAYAPR